MRLKHNYSTSAVMAIVIFSAATYAEDVTSFGARGDGSSDDTAAIQAAISATPAQGTVSFPAGVYKLTRSLMFLSNRTYIGATGAVLKASVPAFIATTEYNATRNLTVDGLTFDGGGIKIDGSTIAGQNVRIVNNTFQNITHNNPNWTLHTAVFLPTGLDSSVISNNIFSNILYNGKTEITDRPTTCIRGWRIKRTQITDNRFDLVN